MSTVDRVREEHTKSGSKKSVLHAGDAAGYDISSPIDVRQDRSTMMLVGFFGTIILTILIALWAGQFAKQETVRGYVSASSGLTRLFTPRAGVVVRVLAKEGDSVEAGQVIASIDVRQVSSGGETTLSLDRLGLTRRQTTLKSEIANIQTFSDRTRDEQRFITKDATAVLDALRRQERDVQLALAQEEDGARKIKRLVAQGFATREKLDVHQRAGREYARQLSEIAVKRTEVRRASNERLNAIETLLNQRSAARAQFETELYDIESKLGISNAEARIDVVASRSGKLAAIAIGQGASVAEGQFIGAIGEADTSDLIIVLDAPSGAIGLAEPGQRVVLKYDAFPYKSFGVQRGTIQSVAAASSDDVSTATQTIAEARISPRQSKFRIVVKPDSKTINAYGAERPIQLGSTLTADIVVERRRLIDWVIDPILALRGRS